jgi:hypothetical protein
MSHWINELRDRLVTRDASGVDAIARTLGDGLFAADFLRVFPIDGPRGFRDWNRPTSWRRCWHNLPEDLLFFGEDVFGNQWGLTPRSPNVILWNHEDGSVMDLMLEPVDLFEVVAESGVEWIDFYRDGMYAAFLAAEHKPTLHQHIHWVQPLILGGTLNLENMSLMDRVQHLEGHGTLWRQLESAAPGTEINLRPK